MSQRKRFSFDDEVDDTIDLSKDDLKNSLIMINLQTTMSLLMKMV